MPVDTQHPEYARMAPQWRIMRDCVRGQSAVHGAKPVTGAPALAQVPGFVASPGSFTSSEATIGASGSWAGEAYLPRLHRETYRDYCARRDRTGFFNATWRTIEGFSGMLFRVDPVVKVSPKTEPLLQDVTKDGTDFDTLALLTAQEDLTVGRVGLYVDYPRGQPDGATVAAAERLNLRPSMAMYLTEQIINWRTSWINNRTVLSLVVLAEIAEVNGDDEFTPKSEQRWRVLDLAPLVNEKGESVGRHAYRVRVYRKVESTVAGAKVIQDELIDEFLPVMNGAPLDYIPFQIIGVGSTTPDVVDPPLIDLANVNLSHYRTTADLEHGAHKTALPQPWIAGINVQNDENGTPIEAEFYMGGGDAWAFPNVETTVGMLEYTGVGLTSLETRLQAKERQMAVLGARMLEDQKSGVEAAETAGIHRSGEQASLATQSRTLSKGLAVVLGWFDAWAGGTGEVEVKINKDFLPTPMDAQKLTALVAAWQAGGISKETLFDNLKQGEVIRDSADFEVEESKIANQPPALLTGAPPATKTPAGTPAA